jgi:hypothetical protein
LGCRGPAACRFDPGDQRLGRGGVTSVVHHDGEAVLGEALGDRGANAAGCAGDDGNLSVWVIMIRLLGVSRRYSAVDEINLHLFFGRIISLNPTI